MFTHLLLTDGATTMVAAQSTGVVHQKWPVSGSTPMSTKSSLTTPTIMSLLLVGVEGRLEVQQRHPRGVGCLLAIVLVSTLCSCSAAADSGASSTASTAPPTSSSPGHSGTSSRTTTTISTLPGCHSGRLTETFTLNVSLQLPKVCLRTGALYVVTLIVPKLARLQRPTNWSTPRVGPGKSLLIVAHDARPRSYLVKIQAVRVGSGAWFVATCRGSCGERIAIVDEPLRVIA